MQILLLLALLMLPFSAHSETRAAFVVGNSAYTNAPQLSNPVRDAQLIGDTLTGLGFDVTRHSDLTRDSFADALSAFLRKTRDADLAFFYFAGHGMQYDGENYLIGTNAELRTELDIESEAIALNKVIELLERNAKAVLVFIDACRDNPLATDFYRRNFSETRALQTRGLARVRSRGDGSMLVFAAAPGQVAYDGEGSNSPFASALARHLPTENVEVLSLTKRIIGEVRNKTGGRQSPIVTNDLTQEVFLREVALRPKTTIVSDGVEQEQSVFDAADQLGTLHAWALYFERYPRGRLSALALQKEHEVLLREVSYLEAGWGRSPPTVVVSDSVAAKFNDRLNLDRNDAVAIQALLRRFGHYNGPLDGKLGLGSRSALRKFQRAQKLNETGIVTRATAQALGLRSRRLTDRPAFSSHRKQLLKKVAAQKVGMDQRMLDIIDTLKGVPVIYGFHDDHLYVATTDFWGPSTYHPSKIKPDVEVYPVSVNSASENRFIYELVRYERTYWQFGYGDDWVHGPMIGLYQPPAAREPSSGWSFVGDTENRFRNWGRGQPDNFKDNQDFARIWVKDDGSQTMPDLPNGPTWDDTSTFSGPIIVEYE